MKIAYFCNEYPPSPHGGIGTYAHLITRGMKEAGHQVTVVGFGDPAEERDDAGIRVVLLPECKIRGIAWLANRLRLHRWLAAEAAAGRVEIIEIPDFCGLMPFPFRSCPVVVRLHMPQTVIARAAGKRPRLMLRLCELWTLKNQPRWIAVSSHVLDIVERCFKLKPSVGIVIHHPVVPPPDAAAGPAIPGRYVLFAGTVASSKGVDTLAEAMRELLAVYPDLHLVYVGALLVESGTAADQRLREAVGPRAAERVHFPGRIDRAKVFDLMRRASVFAFPSPLEGLPFVALEAMLAGAPLVVSNTGPFPEIVRHGETGLMVPPENPAELRQAIRQLLEDQELAGRLAKNAQAEIAQRFSMQQCIGATLEVYSQCLAAEETGAT